MSNIPTGLPFSVTTSVSILYCLKSCDDSMRYASVSMVTGCLDGRYVSGLPSTESPSFSTSLRRSPSVNMP